MKYTYHVNLDERGRFFADVRDEKENTIFEVRAGNELAEDEMDLMEMGYMRTLNDVDGLTTYLQELGILTKRDTIVKA